MPVWASSGIGSATHSSRCTSVAQKHLVTLIQAPQLQVDLNQVSAVHAQIKREVDEILKGKRTSRSTATKTYETLRALKSQDRAAWLAAAAQLRIAASLPYESAETRQTLLDRADECPPMSVRLNRHDLLWSPRCR
jgi:hypothetical protein